MDDPAQMFGNLAVLAVILVGIGTFSSVNTARLGNLAIALALFCALGIEVVRTPLQTPVLVLSVFAVASLTGLVAAGRVTMTQIPALVGFQNGAGGLASCLVSVIQLSREPESLGNIGVTAAAAATIVGAITFSGSMVASGKLAGVLPQASFRVPGYRWISIMVALAIVVVAALAANAVVMPARIGLAMTLVFLCLLAGLLFSARVGGADMPVLISLLNAFSGLSAGICGIVVKSQVLTACGATVAASGLILTYAMCRAMNRNLWSIVWAAAPERLSMSASDCEHSDPPKLASTQEAYKTKVSDADVYSLAAGALESAQKVIVVPGYGMALAHAQLVTVQLANRLIEKNKDLKFAVHPLAGRMPGHMHVLLAEADIDPDLVCDLNDVNGEFAETDVALIVGACDVVNPAAASVEGTPISGMPILAAHEARRVLVCNLDLHPGYSGVDNPLYSDDRTILLLGDADQTVSRLLSIVQ